MPNGYCWAYAPLLQIQMYKFEGSSIPIPVSRDDLRALISFIKTSFDPMESSKSMMFSQSLGVEDPVIPDCLYEEVGGTELLRPVTVVVPFKKPGDPERYAHAVVGLSKHKLLRKDIDEVYASLRKA